MAPAKRRNRKPNSAKGQREKKQKTLLTHIDIADNISFSTPESALKDISAMKGNGKPKIHMRGTRKDTAGQDDNDGSSSTASSGTLAGDSGYERDATSMIMRASAVRTRTDTPVAKTQAQKPHILAGRVASRTNAPAPAPQPPSEQKPKFTLKLGGITKHKELGPEAEKARKEKGKRDNRIYTVYFGPPLLPASAPYDSRLESDNIPSYTTIPRRLLAHARLLLKTHPPSNFIVHLPTASRLGFLTWRSWIEEHSALRSASDTVSRNDTAGFTDHMRRDYLEEMVRCWLFGHRWGLRDFRNWAMGCLRAEARGLRGAVRTVMGGDGHSRIVSGELPFRDELVKLVWAATEVGSVLRLFVVYSTAEAFFPEKPPQCVFDGVCSAVGAREEVEKGCLLFVDDWIERLQSGVRDWGDEELEERTRRHFWVGEEEKTTEEERTDEARRREYEKRKHAEQFRVKIGTRSLSRRTPGGHGKINF
ncbi:hypothetical protein K432DRAFT_426529 [Lepidopterella palustris CBS 459.81]|uniref:Uncharacterized protein n=1 Tax=Lepidopterella palustris CBS 459.81 TaxID=1314670 RepID=A0A8E2JEE6_9PEZI|nr:hypothetical protein K432DRAFT_426529 [Lepidopterella palustris CBS 459.81]